MNTQYRVKSAVMLVGALIQPFVTRHVSHAQQQKADEKKSPKPAFIHKNSDAQSAIYRFNRRLGSTWLRHPGPVNSLAVSASGKLIATSFSSSNEAIQSSTHKVYLWSLAQRKLVRTFSAHGETPFALAFSRDERRLASVAEDSTLRIWNVADGRELWNTFVTDGRAVTPTFSPNGEMVACALNRLDVGLFDAHSGLQLRKLSIPAKAATVSRKVNHETGEKVKTERLDNVIRSIQFGTDSKTLLATAVDGSLFHWSTTNDKFLRHVEGSKKDSYTSVCLQNNGDKVYCFDVTHLTIRASLFSSPKQRRYPLPAMFSAAATECGPSNTTAFGDVRGDLWIVDECSSRVMRRVGKHGCAIGCLGFTGDGQYLVAGSIDGAVRIWDWRNAQEKFVGRGHFGVITSLSFSHDKARLASFAMPHLIFGMGSAYVWDVAGKGYQQVANGRLTHSSKVVFHPTEHVLAISGLDNRTIIFDAESKKKRCVVRLHDGVWSDVVFSPSGGEILMGTMSGEIRIINWKRNAQYEMETNARMITSIRQVGAAPEFMILEEDGGIFLFQPQLNRLDRLQTGIAAPRFFASCAGRNLFVVGERTFARWNPMLRKFSKPLRLPPLTSSVAICGSRGVIAVGTNRGDIHLLRVRNGASIGSLQKHRYKVSALEFSSDGSLLASGDTNSQIYLWRISKKD